MGSHGNGLLLGVRKKAPKKLGDDGWNALAGRYKGGERPVTPWGKACRGELLGFYVALGHEREQEGVPTLTEPLQLAGGPESWPEPIYRRYLAASKAWVAFVQWAEGQGYVLELGAYLWIVETEVG